MNNIRAAGPSDTNDNDVLSAETTRAKGAIVIIEKRALIRDCLGRCLGNGLGCPVLTFCDMAAWERLAPRTRAAVIIMSGQMEHRRDEECDTIRQLGQGERVVPVVVMSDADDKDRVANTLKCGARGFIPSDTPLEIVIEAIRLILVGGLFIPANIMLPESRPAAVGREPRGNDAGGVFTARESAVIEALRQGKANKLIASDLQMSESTVKVHVHNVMKKLRVSNRTEAVIKIAQLAQDGQWRSGSHA